jgi:small subunit ribosomal protein S17e
MGRIKSALIKRTARKLVEKTAEGTFSNEFNDNKKPLSNNTMPSKRLRNKIAGYITRLNKNTEKLIKEDKQDE